MHRHASYTVSRSIVLWIGDGGELLAGNSVSLDDIILVPYALEVCCEETRVCQVDFRPGSSLVPVTPGQEIAIVGELRTGVRAESLRVDLA